MKPWKSALTPRFSRSFSGFNGATAMKPWKSPHANRWTTGCEEGFNGATAMKPWKRHGC